MVKMSDLTDSDINNLTLKRTESDESTLTKTVRLTINLMINILMCVTVFVSLLYTFASEKITVFQLHIILYVLGYQLFMCQGTLVMSKYNSWSMYLSWWNKKCLHILFQLLGFVLVVVGSSVIINEEKHHFNSTHGCLGEISLIISSVSIANGALATYAYKLSTSYVLLIKFIHYTSGILTLFISAAALSTGFQEYPFRMWVKDDHAVSGLIFITWAFTLLVAIDFWLLNGQKLCKLYNNCFYYQNN